MALTWRQKIAYTDTVDIYRMNDPLAASNGVILDAAFDATAVATSVKCLYLSAPHDNRFVAPVGRSIADNMDTLDRFHFEAGQTIHDMDLLKMTTANHPNAGEYFQVQGTGKVRTSRGGRKGNYQRIYARRVARPSELALQEGG